MEYCMVILSKVFSELDSDVFIWKVNNYNHMGLFQPDGLFILKNSCLEAHVDKLGRVVKCIVSDSR